ncbi:hypothetical protein BBF96_11980 [Anoxybacter fermentans]|uniref:Transposase n=1 Tax=Anoxybacter fermentans TaxID=1323375 RepID=A0A3Q9HRY6_9FIRM|nr:hypothetical protein BBF96_11980 [Anoxybacter fermentans]
MPTGGFWDYLSIILQPVRTIVRKFNRTNIFQEIFDEIVLQAMDKGLIEGKELFTDSTFLKANANKNKYTKEIVIQSTKSYIEELDKAIEENRLTHGKKPFKKDQKE